MYVVVKINKKFTAVVIKWRKFHSGSTGYLLTRSVPDRFLIGSRTNSSVS